MRDFVLAAQFYDFFQQKLIVKLFKIRVSQKMVVPKRFYSLVNHDFQIGSACQNLMEKLIVCFWPWVPDVSSDVELIVRTENSLQQELLDGELLA